MPSDSLPAPKQHMAGGHRADLPEVTFGRRGIADAATASQHGRMPDALRNLLHPMHLAGLCTLGAVAMSLRWIAGTHPALAWALLGAFAIAQLSHDGVRRRSPRTADALLLLMPVLALLLLWINPRVGTAQVLLVIWTAVVASHWSGRAVVAAIALSGLGQYLLMLDYGHSAPLTVTLLYTGFQGFAAVTACALRNAENSRDALVRVNADLLATRALLADSARDSERVRVARELHDVAGHTLTALTLNLRALASDPQLRERAELRIAQQLCGELMGDIRGVVQAMRDGGGLDLTNALHALAAPFPRPRLALQIAPDLRIRDPALAEAVLRMVQEALTNSARHAGATTLAVSLVQHDGCLRVAIEDDGHLHGAVREGNGLAGMRERIDALGGRLALATGPRGALRIEAELPA